MTNIQFQRSAIDASGAFSSAWEQVKGSYGTYLGASLVAMILISCLYCISWFLMGPILGGFYYLSARGYRGEYVEFGMMFEGFKKFVPLMAVGLLVSVPSILATIVQTGMNFADLGLLLRNPEAIQQVQRTGEFGTGDPAASPIFLLIVVGAALFNFFWWAITYFAIPLVMEYDLGPVEAFKLSAQAAFGNLGGLLGVVIFGILAALIGMLLLCIGIVLVSWPVILVANAIVFNQVFPRQDRGDQFFAPPPPGAYGFGDPQY